MKKVFFLLMLFPIISICQSSDPETILRDKEERERIRQEKEDAKNIFPFPKDSGNNSIKYTGVEVVQNTSAQELYSRGRLFIANVYRSGKDVTQLNDDVAKTILGKGAGEVIYSEALGPKRRGLVKYQIKIECKDNRYRYTIDQLTFNFVVDTGFDEWLFDSPKRPRYVTKKSWYNIQESSDERIRSLIETLKSAMSKASSDF